MAQYLEKALDDDGKFEEFKEICQKAKVMIGNMYIALCSRSPLTLALQMAKK